MIKKWGISAVYAGLFGFLLLSVTVAVVIGPADISPVEAWRLIAHKAGFADTSLTLIEQGIVWDLRLPRVLTAAFVGAGLAVTGTVMQALTRNQLADPYLLGISSGASLGAVLVLILGVSLVLPLAAFVGALVALMATLFLARSLGAITPSRTILSGIAVSSLMGALTSLVIFWSSTGDSYRSILNWLLGSLAGSNWQSVSITLFAMLLVGLPLLVSSKTLDAFLYGEGVAASLGINVRRARWLLLIGAALLTGAMVSVSGSIGFVGLVLPNAVRLITGPMHKNLLWLSALGGAVFMVWVDTIARTAFDPRELPVGIITVLVGAPFFAFILWRNRGVS